MPKPFKIFTRNNIPNFITSIRFFSFLLFFFRPFSIPFLVILCVVGLSDGVDGFVARKMKLVSQKGAKLDSVADLLFYATMMARIIPFLWRNLPSLIWYIIGVILAIRFFSYFFTYFTTQAFSAMHTIPNKITGLLMFGLPFMCHLSIEWPSFSLFVYCIILETVALLAAVHEVVLHIWLFHKSKHRDRN